MYLPAVHKDCIYTVLLWKDSFLKRKRGQTARKIWIVYFFLVCQEMLCGPPLLLLLTQSTQIILTRPFYLVTGLSKGTVLLTKDATYSRVCMVPLLFIMHLFGTFVMLPWYSKYSLCMLSSHVNLCFSEALRLNIFISLLTLGNSCPIPDDILFLDSCSVRLYVLDVYNTDCLLLIILSAICWCIVTP